ncbi:hypothetical protein D3C83_245430 [compost metagenome]
MSFCSITGNRAITGTRSFRQRSATGSNRSTLSRSTPGMEATFSTRFFPSRMKTG